MYDCCGSNASILSGIVFLGKFHGIIVGVLTLQPTLPGYVLIAVIGSIMFGIRESDGIVE
ncbi:MAG: hypothetical protein COB90_03555 [Hyphomicrobiales bacterium]|nr:MAG: hypothetical protein COB90_03555 [Hyphomicrobiales bacterium]